MGDMKKLMEGWRNYEKEVLQEYWLLPSLLTKGAAAPGYNEDGSPQTVGDGPEFDIDTRASLPAALKDTLRRDAEWNQILDPELRREYQSLLDSTENREDPDEALLQASEGKFSSRRDLQAQVDMRYSDLVFDPNDPLDYISAAAIFAGGSGFFTKAALAAEKLGRIQDVRKLTKMATKAKKVESKTWKGIESYQIANVVSHNEQPAIQKGLEQQANIERYQSEQSTGDEQLDAYSDEDEYEDEVEAPVEPSADPELNESWRAIKAFGSGVLDAAKAGAKATKKSLKTPSGSPTPTRAARKAASATFREGTPAKHKRIKLGDGTAVDLPQVGSGKTDIQIKSAQNAIREREALQRQLTGTKMKKAKAEMVENGKSPEAIENTLNEIYDNGMAEINDWTAGLYHRSVSQGVVKANIDFGVTVGKASKGVPAPGVGRVGEVTAETQKAIAVSRKPDMLTDSPAGAQSWRDNTIGDRGWIEKRSDAYAATNGKPAFRSQHISRNIKGYVGTAVVGAGVAIPTAMALKSASDTKAAIEGDPIVADLIADPEETVETEPGPTAGDPQANIPAEQPTVVSEPLTKDEKVSPKNLKSGDEVVIDGEEFRADESVNRSKRVGNIIREEVIRYLNRRAK
jgi:hypothetical protein